MRWYVWDIRVCGGVGYEGMWWYVVVCDMRVASTWSTQKAAELILKPQPLC